MAVASVLLERGDPIAWLRLNRPEAHNAFDDEMTATMPERVRELAGDPDVRVAILCGNGPSFCTGVDVKALGRRGIDIEWFARWHRILAELENLDVPLIVAIQGHCLGGGLMLTLTADYRLAAEDVSIGLGAVRHGILPGSAPELLPSIVGSVAARRLCLFSEYVDADEALRIGLVDRVVAVRGLEREAVAVAERACRLDPTAVRECKALLREAQTLDAAGYERAYLEAQQRCLDARSAV